MTLKILKFRGNFLFEWDEINVEFGVVIYQVEMFSFSQQDLVLQNSSFIIFRDDDTSKANTNIDFKIINDSGRIFNHTCIRAQNGKETAFYCSELCLKIHVDISHDFILFK